MRGIILLIVFILFITIIFPITLIKGYDVFNFGEDEKELVEKYEIEEIQEDYKIEIYDINTKKVITMEFEEYIKGVVAAELPGAFHLEALKAQAVAARTFSMYRLDKYKNGNPPVHPETALCTGIHCQAYISKEKLREVKGRNWMYEYWTKIEKAVEDTKGEVLTYEGRLIEPLFHSTSGGMTENSEDVFVSALPYLRSVDSPYEQGAPKLISVEEMKVSDFIKKIKSKFPKVNINKGNLDTKIKEIERSEGGKVKEIRIDNVVATGRDIRQILGLNSTNFKISMNKEKESIKITTIGYGHGVGMSQWGAHGMAENGSSYSEILKHYYTGVRIKEFY